MTASNTKLQRQLALQMLTQKNFKNKFGADAGLYRGAGAATLIGADISEGIAKHGNLTREIASDELRRDEIAGRSEIAIDSIIDKGKAVQSAQKSAFIKGGVELEGSAINVVAETAEQAVEAARISQREVDFDLAQLDLATALKRTKADGLAMETLLNVAASGASAYMGAGGS